MNNISMPGFTAPCSIYTDNGRYQSFGGGRSAFASTVLPQLNIGDGSVKPALINEGNGDTGTNQDALEQQGYHCAVVSLGNVECTKAGSPTYTCSRGTCIKSPWSLQSSGSSGLPSLGGFLPRRRT